MRGESDGDREREREGEMSDVVTRQFTHLKIRFLLFLFSYFVAVVVATALPSSLKHYNNNKIQMNQLMGIYSIVDVASGHH